jgi:subtilisin family serine protease
MLFRISQRSKSTTVIAATLLALVSCTQSQMPHRSAGTQPASFIVEAGQGGTLAAHRAVEAVGGRVTAELPIIDAVVAQLTQRQRQRLAAQPGIRSLFADAPVELKADRANVRDNFDRVQWNNNDGRHRWATPWIESGDDGSPLTGKVAITLDLLASGRLAFTGASGAVTRSAGLPPGALKASLSFDVRRVSLETGDYVAVEASRDGISWREVGRIKGPANDAALAGATIDVSPYIGAATSIRFVSHLTPALLNADAVYVDGVDLEYDSVYANGVSYPSLAGADPLHAQGVNGLLVTVAVLDTGYWKHPALDTTALGLSRVLAQYDAIGGTSDSNTIDLLGITSLGTTVSTDGSGHGTHVTGIMLNTQRTADGRYFGLAPNANLVSVRAFDADGRGTYSSVIRGIDWIVQHKDAYRIRVLNLSLGATPRSYYWDDPLNRAVMKAWKAGIAVVVSAGNGGPDPQTITVPGNVPYVITVGAMTDNYTPANPADDRLASFSSAGPTYEGFVKPEVVAPGGHIWSLMPTSARIAQEHPSYQNDGDFFTMSGTSQAAAVVSGAVALLLQAEPGLTPNEVKCKLMASARPALNSSGQRAYSVFQQGAGLINAYDARYETRRDCANRGLDIDKDLAGTEHYGGPARQNTDGAYYLTTDPNGSWDQGYAWDQGYLWRKSYDDDETWSQGYLWRKNADDDSSVAGSGDTAAMAINQWVNQE